MNYYFLKSVISVWGSHCDYSHSVQKDLTWTGWSSVAETVATLEPRAVSAVVMSVEHSNDYALQFSMEIKNE